MYFLDFQFVYDSNILLVVQDIGLLCGVHACWIVDII